MKMCSVFIKIVTGCLVVSSLSLYPMEPYTTRDFGLHTCLKQAEALKICLEPKFKEINAEQAHQDLVRKQNVALQASIKSLGEQKTVLEAAIAKLKGQEDSTKDLLRAHLTNLDASEVELRSIAAARPNMSSSTKGDISALQDKIRKRKIDINNQLAGVVPSKPAKGFLTRARERIFGS
jgi:hypothetical protein